MGTYKVNDIKGIVRDVGFGKHPDGTFNSLINFDADYEQGSLVSRTGYGTYISPPSGLSSAKWMLNAPVNYPTATDMFLLYDNDSSVNTYLYPYWHNSSTATNAWMNVQDYVDVGHYTSTSNVIILTGSSGIVENKYKNWVFIHDGTNNKYFVKSSTESGSLILDRQAPASGSSGRLIRYYHDKTKNFFSTYTTPTNPACYSTDLAIRWSVGNSSNTYHKNMWAGYINRTFFSNDADDKYTFTGTYITEAECKAPTTEDLGTPTLTSSASGESQITNAQDRSFQTATDTNWTGGANVIITKSNLSILEGYTSVKGSESTPDEIWGNYKTLRVNLTNTGSAHTMSLADNKFTDLLNNTAYKIIIQCYNPTSSTIVLNFVMGGQTIPVSIASSVHSGISSICNVSVPFTSLSTGAQTSLSIYSDTVATIDFLYIDIAYAQPYIGLNADTTYTLFGSFVYDGFQESEFVKLSEFYQTTPKQKITYQLKIDFASLNKRITGVRTYIDTAKGDTTTNSNRNFTKYLLSDISIVDNDTGWVFNSGTNLFEYTDTIDNNKLDVAKYNLTWEQKTNRIASNSTTCSYDIAKSCAGRIFLAREYDYSDAKEYTQRVRYTGFNGDGVMCPDIFPNITDINITYIPTGSGVKINALAELDGSLIVVKEGSIVELTTSDLVELWRLKVVDNNFSSLGKNSVLNTNSGMIFGGTDDMIIWRGGDTQSIVDGVWKNLYQSEVDISNPDGFFITKKKSNGNIIIYPDTTPSGENTSYEFNLKNFIPKSNQFNSGFLSISQLKDNTNVGMITDGTLYKFDKSYVSDYVYVILPTFKTNKILPDSKHNVTISEIFLTIEGSGTINSSSSFTLIGDGSTIQSYTITGSNLTNTIKFYRFKVKPHKPVKYVELELGAGLSATSTVNGLKIHEYGFEFETKKEFGDVSYT